MDDLYDSDVESLSNSDKKEFEKVSNAFQDVAKWLHSKKAFTPEMLDEPEPTALISATHNVLSEELRRIERNIPDKMAQALDENIFLFSGFKTYHELNDASRLLKDEDGGFKPFEKFLQDVRLIDAKYNQNYLYAEYNFATASTQMAAKWSDIERDGDDYDLQYRTAMDGLVREEHAALEGITLPPSDKFWNKYYPPNGWNCRCTAVQVLKDKYPRSDSNQACEAGERATTHIGNNGENKSAIFRFNPGKEGKVFPPKHPYYKAPTEAKNTVNTIVATMITTTGKTNVAKERERLYNSGDMPTIQGHQVQSNLSTGRLLRSNKVLDRFLSHSRTMNELDAAKYIWNNPDKLHFVKPSPFGEVKDLTNPADLKNLANKQKRGVVGYNVYEFTYNGKTWKLKLEEHKHGFEQFYSWYIE